MTPAETVSSTLVAFDEWCETNELAETLAVELGSRRQREPLSKLAARFLDEIEHLDATAEERWLRLQRIVAAYLDNVRSSYDERARCAKRAASALAWFEAAFATGSASNYGLRDFVSIAEAYDDGLERGELDLERLTRDVFDHACFHWKSLLTDVESAESSFRVASLLPAFAPPVGELLEALESTSDRFPQLAIQGVFK